MQAGLRSPLRLTFHHNTRLWPVEKRHDYVLADLRCTGELRHGERRRADERDIHLVLGRLKSALIEHHTPHLFRDVPVCAPGDLMLAGLRIVY